MPANILIGVPMGAGVAAEFLTSFLPAINLLPEEGQMRLERIKWGNTVSARNNIVRDFLADSSYTHLFFMDSDMCFPENVLSRMLMHDVDIVGGLYTIKIPPFNTTAFVRNEAGEIQNYVPDKPNGIVEIEAIGTGCMLIKREVLEAMKWPYFFYQEDPPGSGKMMTEDSYFCIKAREKGFKVYCDTNVLCKHIGTASVEPTYTETGLKASLEMV